MCAKGVICIAGRDGGCSVHLYNFTTNPEMDPAVFTDVYHSKFEAEPFFKLVETKFQKHNTSNSKISVQLFNIEVNFLHMLLDMP